MAEDRRIIQRNSSKQDAKAEEEGGHENGAGKKTEVNSTDEGYETPTSEEHTIPEVDSSCPPPAPKKRKRLFLHGKKLQQVKMLESSVRLRDGELELFFQSYAVESRVRVPAAPRPEAIQSVGAKKRRIKK